MSESKQREEEIEKIKAQEAERQKAAEEFARQQKEADDRLAQLIATPLSKEDAEKAFADNKVAELRLTVLRSKWMTRIDVLQDEINKVRRNIADIDDQITSLRFDDAVTFRRTLNPPAGKPAMGEPVGPGAEGK